MKPAFNQIELHPYFQQKELCDYCDKNMINIMAYSPMSKDALIDEQICTIANYRGCAPSVVVMSWILNTGAALAVKSVNHITENLNLNFTLTEREFGSIKDKNIRIIQER